jgi:hypothetical protein
MLIAYCVAAILAGLICAVGLWPSLGPLALLAAPFGASVIALCFGVVVTWRMQPRSAETLAAPDEQARALRRLVEAAQQDRIRAEKTGRAA